jgi:hypothetical protein
MAVQKFENEPIPTNRLIPYAVIICAVQGDPTAMDQVISYYNPYIAYLSRRNVRDEEGFFTKMPNHEIEAQLTSRLVRAVVRFKILSGPSQVK